MNILGILSMIIRLYTYLVLAYVLLSWIPSALKFRQAIEPYVEPILKFIREKTYKIFPSAMNIPLDFSPIILILLLQMLTQVLYAIF